MATTKKADRHTRPALEGLEDRRLLSAPTRLVNGTAINIKDLRRLEVQLTNVDSTGQRIPASDRRIQYTTPGGQTAIVTLYGHGSLAGSTVTNGALNLVYNKTDVSSRIVGRIYGRGNGPVPLLGIRDADSTPGSPSSTGVDPLNGIVMPQWDLVNSGYVNLTGGIIQLQLHSIGANTQLQLKQGKPAPTSTQTVNVITSGGASIGGVTPTNTVSQTTTTTTGFQGVELVIRQINAAPLGTPPLNNPQVFSIDTTLDQLVRFDVVTGNPTLAVPLPTIPSGTTPALALAKVNGHSDALVGIGDTVYAYNGFTGALEGSFSIASLASDGLTRVDGIGASDTGTLLVQTQGPAVPIDVSASVNSGSAVATGAPYNPSREMVLAGGASGLAGSSTLYATVGAHFDSFQPNLDQLGVAALTPSGGTYKESSRTAVTPQGGGFITLGPPTTIKPSSTGGFGSIEGELALLSGVSGGKNVVDVYDPSTLKFLTKVTLNDPHPLQGLSESFHPELNNAALIVVSGNIDHFVADRAQGLVLNGQGEANFVYIGNAADSTVIGRPLDHVQIPRRRNVQLLSTARGIDGLVTRNGVQVVPKLSSVGPVDLP
jgi:hypothetical protein